MANFLKKLFGSITEKPWEKDRVAIDTAHAGRTFEISTIKIFAFYSVSKKD